MPHYIVRETFTTLTRIEADDEAAALARREEQSPRHFDEIDCSAPMKTTVSLDPDEDA